MTLSISKATISLLCRLTLSFLSSSVFASPFPPAPLRSSLLLDSGSVDLQRPEELCSGLCTCTITQSYVPFSFAAQKWLFQLQVVSKNTKSV